MYKINVHRINFCEYNLIAGNSERTISSEILFFLIRDVQRLSLGSRFKNKQ
nr:MAG TPA: hypothetical protein [Bacteriophage sp.]